MNKWRHLSLFVLAFGMKSGYAQTLESDLELAQIKAQKAAIEAEFSTRLSDCYQRFNVNDCRARVLTEQNKALQPIMERQRQLFEQQRQIKADQRREKIRSRGSLE